MNHPTKIIMVEDHQLFRLGISTALKSQPEKYNVVGEASNAAEFFQIIETTDADIVLLDIHLPDQSGIEIARKLIQLRPAMKILVLSAENDAETISKLIETGINGFISKNATMKELFIAIDYIEEGAEYFGKDISKIIRDIKVAKKDGKDQFTERENEIIALCSEGLTAKEIADRMYINVATVNTHKNNIFKKLGINNSVELVIYAMKNGIIKL
ncbi:MAG: response regulator transcription factor [Bacteroidales bacterium]|nr:response regulator transcription factor [Bacteroidales bacterium]